MMKGSKKIILGVATVAARLTAGAPAFADNGRGNWDRDGNRGRDKNQNTYVYRNYDHQEVGRTNYNYQRNIARPETIRIYDNDRAILNRYIESSYRTSYKPNLYHNHGYGNYYNQGPRKYMIGYPLPNYVTYYTVPYEVRSRMRPTPIGYQYIRVDNDVLLMNMATKQIIDAVVLLASGSR